ncbi:DUF3558 domain-containing protein [Nocardia elegans]|uniref:DUF3558 family protein n=1 Tax=Nocardia elegans TaxID=300029 RepID=A0ABW6T8W0_9NOCA|nr:DUF3558 family protein [Nocardia elegans]MBF6448780.1 DUF3558 domain-containing protein [Nocardia elegans]
MGAALSIGMFLGSAGCSGNSDSAVGEKTPTTTVTTASASSDPASNTAWNPCSIPDADIAAAGLNPAKKLPDTGKYGQKFPGWDICGWLSDSWYSLSVYSTNSHTFNEVAGNTILFRNPQSVTISDRKAVLLHSADDPESCTIVFDIVKSPVQFEVNAKASADTPGDSCSEVSRIAGILVKDLPA